MVLCFPGQRSFGSFHPGMDGWLLAGLWAVMAGCGEFLLEAVDKV